ncbi:MAG: efflux RND transporter periplasmic adaptor subunit [Burkholderiales bacterium]
MNFPNMAHGIAILAFMLALSGCDAGSQPGQGDHPEEDTHTAHEDSPQEMGHAEPRGVVLLTVDEIRSAGIQVERVRQRTISEPITVTAEIGANRDRLAHVAPRVPARIIEVTANLGDRVATGQKLALLDSPEVAETHAAYQQARTDLSVARAAFERAEKLAVEQIIAQKEYLRIRGEFERAEAAFRAAGDRLRILGVSPPDTDADSTTVSVFPLRSPFTGIIIEKHAILGELADPEKSLFTVADLSVLWIEADIYEKDLGRVKVGGKAEVSVAAYPETVFRGELTYVSDVMNAQTRTVKARIEVPNPARRLKPHMFATARIGTTSEQQVIALPSDAVTLIDGKPSVFVPTDDGFEVRSVQTGERLGELTVIADGLVAGEPVVVAGAFAVKARMLKSALGSGHAH